MSERSDQEALIERGSWVEHFNLYRLTSADGIVRYNVHVDPRLGSYRLWVFFWAAHYMPKADEGLVARWRRRRG